MLHHITIQTQRLQLVTDYLDANDAQIFIGTGKKRPPVGQSSIKFKKRVKGLVVVVVVRPRSTATPDFQRIKQWA